MPPEQSPLAQPRIERDEQLKRLRDVTFDVAVIGGGINGTAIARDAAMRGFKVALVDQGDFAGATSSRSSKLIHGGLRYLPHGQLRLVRHALDERERLRRVTAPHLVHPIRFLFPFYRGRKPGRFAVGLGLMFYDYFAGTPEDERHQRLDAMRVTDFEPGLRTDGLNGGAVYYDAWGDDARLTLENALDAAYHGAAIANYVALQGLSKDGAHISAAGMRDLISGASFELRARRFVNAAGPWVDDVRRMDDPNAAPCVRLTKGVHLIVSKKRLPLRNALVLSDNTGRIVFVLPRDNYVMVGTTDTDFNDDRAKVAADAQDVAYLLSVVADAMPGVRVAPGDVAYSFAGLRSLMAARGRLPPSSVSREEVILESRSGLHTVAGGKLTAHREIAEKVVDRLAAVLKRGGAKSSTAGTPLPGARALATVGEEANDYRHALAELPGDVRQILNGRYGTRAAQVARLAHQRSELSPRLAPDAPAIGAEVVYAVRAEMARSIADFLVRRTAMVWRAPYEAAAAAPAVAHILAAELGWNGARERAELEEFMAVTALGTAAAAGGDGQAGADARSATR
ncbi:MAG: FAD-dependent oxidoreductase [Candidatus Binataceae bacterium]